MDKFKHLIGQDKTKRRLSYYLKLHKKTSLVPFILYGGEKGAGKTEFARTFMSNLENSDGSKRHAIELNCSDIRNVDSFFDHLFVPEILDNEVTVFFDECHALPKCLVNAFLTVFNTEDKTNKNYLHKGQSYLFDFKMQSFFFATTEIDKLFVPFKDRLTIVDLEPYQKSEIERIVSKVCKGLKIDDKTLQEIGSRTRGNARSAVKTAKELKGFCETEDIIDFGQKELEKFIYTIDLNLHGLNNIEKNILKILKNGECSLQELSAKTGLSRTAIQRESEVHLLRKGLMKIDGKRQITKEGRNVLEIK